MEIYGDFLKNKLILMKYDFEKNEYVIHAFIDTPSQLYYEFESDTEEIWCIDADHENGVYVKYYELRKKNSDEIIRLEKFKIYNFNERSLEKERELLKNNGYKIVTV